MNEQLSNFKVTDRQSFIVLIDLLRQYFLQSPNRWQNKTIDNFLEALGVYATEIQVYYNNTGASVNTEELFRRTFADIF
jgi:hypothetical protein